MGEMAIIDLVREALWVAFIMALPILGTALAVGLIIGLLQALTSIQELTLTFVPKLIAVGLAFWLTMGFTGALIGDFFAERVVATVAGNP